MNPAKKVTRKENLRTADDVRRIAAMCDALGVAWKWTGLCLWAFDRGGKQGEELIRLGANWSAKKGAHYWRVPDNYELPRTILEEV